MKKTPDGWPRISPSMFYDDAPAAIGFLCRAFGFEVRLKVEGEGGRIEHSELVFGDGLVMVSTAQGPTKDGRAPSPGRSPRSLSGANTQTLCLFVDDVEAHCERARKAGAKIVDPPLTSDYGDEYWADLCYRAEDPEGHQWWFIQRLRTGGKDA